MRHLIVSREYPPAPYPPGGIGTYVVTIARLLAEAGEIVHVIAQQWSGAPLSRECLLDGRLTIHRVPLECPSDGLQADARFRAELEAVPALAQSSFPQQAFAWQAALLAERLVESEAIDVIEAQEWEAPLYYFQLRRALQLGPAHQPPCIIHLHSPTEFIFRYNEWPTDRPDYLTTMRLEDYSIGAADAWLCPSQFLARESERHYSLPEHSVSVIPIPVGNTPFMDRAAAVWERGPMCFVGRLEPRKGVVEWVDAAVSTAAVDSALEFDFIGADLVYMPGVSVQKVLERRIPPDMHGRFHFRGSRPRAEVIDHLARARIAVIPSRWENFPNTCIEAMASGLPVIVSPNGGMREMVEDGRTGWIAPLSTPAGLAEALRRALDTPPLVLAEMGRAASQAVREICRDSRIVASHIDMRRRVAERGAHRSLRLPASLPWSRRPERLTIPTVHASERSRTGTAVIVTVGSGDGMSSDSVVAALAECMTSVNIQTRPPAARLLVDTLAVRRCSNGRDLLARARDNGWTVVESGMGHHDNGLSESIAHVCTDPALLAVAIVDVYECLAPTFIERGEDVLRVHDQVAIVSSWTNLENGGWLVEPCPTLPFQLLANGASGASVFRVEALAAVGEGSALVDAAYQVWGAATAILADGWAGVTYPELLVRRTACDMTGDQIRAHLGRPRARRQILDRVPAALAAGAHELVLHLEFVATGSDQTSESPWPTTAASGAHVRWALAVLADAVRVGVRHPRFAARWLAPQVWHATQGALRRAFVGPSQKRP